MQPLIISLVDQRLLRYTSFALPEMAVYADLIIALGKTFVRSPIALFAFITLPAVFTLDSMKNLHSGNFDLRKKC